MKIIEKQTGNNLVDLSFLNQICDGDQDFMNSIVETFIEDAPTILYRLLDYTAKADWLQVSQAAHQLKPSLQFMGLNNTLDQVKTIEQRSKQMTELETLDVLVHSVQHEINQAIIELKEHFNK